MADILAATYDLEASDINWSVLGQVYLFGNDKGGVGKSTLASNTAGLTAAGGLRTLVVDLNAQGNVALDLGVFGKEGVDDGGRSLYLGITADEPLRPAKNVRQNLDLLPGGDYIRKIAGALAPSMSSQDSARIALLALARGLAAIAKNYDVIIIDSPPENEMLLQLALCAARFVVVPMKTDEASRLGLRRLAKNLRSMRTLNPHMVLLGIVIFASGTGATKTRESLRGKVEHDLKGGAPVFTAFIRHAEAVGVAARNNGLLIHELEQRLRDNPKFWELRAGTADKSTVVVPETARKVAGDIESLLKEIFSRAKNKRMELTKEGLWP